MQEIAVKYKKLADVLFHKQTTACADLVSAHDVLNVNVEALLTANEMLENGDDNNLDFPSLVLSYQTSLDNYNDKVHLYASVHAEYDAILKIAVAKYVALLKTLVVKVMPVNVLSSIILLYV